MNTNAKIVAADDESHILNVVSMKLKNAGYQVLTAVDGEEALELCRAERPALLITDYQMPFLTGVEVCKRLRADESTKNIPAMLLTARGFDLEQDELSEAGIAAVLGKPFSPRELLEKVNSLLNQTAGAARE